MSVKSRLTSNAPISLSLMSAEAQCISPPPWLWFSEVSGTEARCSKNSQTGRLKNNKDVGSE